MKGQGSPSALDPIRQQKRSCLMINGDIYLFKTCPKIKRVYHLEITNVFMEFPGSLPRLDWGIFLCANTNCSPILAWGQVMGSAKTLWCSFKRTWIHTENLTGNLVYSWWRITFGTRQINHLVEPSWSSFEGEWGKISLASLFCLNDNCFNGFNHLTPRSLISYILISFNQCTRGSMSYHVTKKVHMYNTHTHTHTHTHTL